MQVPKAARGYLDPMFALRLLRLRIPAPRTQPPAAVAAQAADPVPALGPTAATAVVARPGGGLAVADPVGLRVVPLRPDSSWPVRRARDRISNPFRSFPYRAMYLAEMMAAPEAQDRPVATR